LPAWIFAGLLFLIFITGGFRLDAQDAASTWQRAIAPWTWLFPRDHGAHPNFKTEWWYFTGNVHDAAGRPFGYQLTIFRQGVQFRPAQAESRWAVRDFYFGHFTVSDIGADRFHVEERVSRGALGEAHAATDRMDVALGPWTILEDAAQEKFHLAAKERELAIDFDETPAQPLVLEGVNGLSRKSDGVGEASYYYSYPRLATTGRITVGGKDFAVTGTSWFDHEFSTSSLGKDQAGWDWFCLQFDDGEDLMLYAMRDKSGAWDPVSEGTWIGADGKSERLEPGSFTLTATGSWRSAASGTTYPSGWRIEVPRHRATLTVAPAMSDQELRLSKLGPLDYWEGACTIRGTVNGATTQGVGYTELTGYAGGLQAGLGE
jgi:predicted secreted hydrolase